MEEKELLAARLADLRRRCGLESAPAYTAFLTPEEQREAEAFCKSRGFPGLAFWGGALEAERRLAGFCPEGWDEARFQAEAPVDAVRAEASDTGLTHRDYLGALMGLGLRRAFVGDISVNGKEALFFVTGGITSFVLENLAKAGRLSVRCALLPAGQAVLPPRQAGLLRFTVASARLDGILAGLFHLSRGDAAALIAGGQARVNDRVCVKPDRKIAGGDVLSLKGRGKARILGSAGLSRRGRTVFEAEIYR